MQIKKAQVNLLRISLAALPLISWFIFRKYWTKWEPIYKILFLLLTAKIFLPNQRSFFFDWDSVQRQFLRQFLRNDSFFANAETRSRSVRIAIFLLESARTRLTRPKNWLTRPSQALFIRVLPKNSHGRETRVKLGIGRFLEPWWAVRLNRQRSP